jgi:cation diffusion facilitator CzcD-associated flavoprotein CzcO
MDREVVVVGAGAAGLATAARLRRRRIEAVVLDRADEVGSSWRGRYDGVRLNTVRWLSGMPGMRIPRSAGPWPSRDEYVSYLERYAERLDIRTGVGVERIDRTADGYRLETSAGTLTARFVVVATGYDNTPVLPDWPGRDEFTGELLHSSRYRNAAPFRGRDVLVVGSGNTGLEIAAELVEAGAASVRVAMRTPPNILRRNMFGMPSTLMAWLSMRQPGFVVDRVGVLLQRLLWGDLTRYGIGRPPYGIATELKVKGLGPVLDTGFIEGVKSGRIEVVRAVESFDRPDVVLRGTERIQPDVVIAATGYRMGLERLVGHLGVLTPSGRPRNVDGRAHQDAPRLYFVGFWLPLVGQLPAMPRTSRRVARDVARELPRRAEA